ncbi:MAG: ABC-F family ATP-binding cassette domain-containing protein [Planctomycetota bacterium]
MISATQLSKAFGDRPILQEAQFHLEAGDRVGLLGVNGAGKSTLLTILFGRLAPDSGEVRIRKGTRIGYLEQSPDLPADRTAREVVASGLAERQALQSELADLHAAGTDDSRTRRRLQELEDQIQATGGWDLDTEVEKTLQGLGLRDPGALVGRMSGGERRRVSLGRLLVSHPDLLLLDEPTNHLDTEVASWLESTLVQCGATILMVTHDRYFLERVATRIFELDRAKIHSYEGAYEDYLVQRAERLELETQAEQGRAAFLRNELRWILRRPSARRTKSKSRIREFERIQGLDPEPPPGEVTLPLPPGPRLGNKVLIAQGLTRRIGERTLFKDLDIELAPGERVGIVGPNGAGKTTLLETLLGMQEPDAGTIELGPRVKFAHFDQARDSLDPDATLIEAIGADNDHVQIGERSQHIVSFLEALLFPKSRHRARCSALSGGERARILLAQLLFEGGNVLVFDEPTNDLDIMTLRILEEALTEFPGCVLTVSHDRYFLDRIATRIIALDGEGGATVHAGDYESFREWHEEEERGRATREQAAKKTARIAAPASKESDRPKKLSYKEQRELEELETEIERLEASVSELEAKLADPAIYASGPEKGRTLATELETKRKRHETLLDRWSELAERA